jgi:predicted ATPase
MRCSGGASPQLGEDGHLSTIRQCQIREFDAQLRDALDSSSFLHLLDLSDERLTAPRDHPTIYHDRLVQGGREMVANLVAVARKEIVRANQQNRSRWNG